MLKESQRGVNELYMRKMRTSIKAGAAYPRFSRTAHLDTQPGCQSAIYFSISFFSCLMIRFSSLDI